MSSQPTITQGTQGPTTPPPLPTPGTGGREEIPGAGAGGVGQEAPAPARHHGVGCGGGFGTRLGKYVVGIGLLVAIWAMSGGGSFWPLWAMIGWGFFVVFGGGHDGPRGRHGRTSRPSSA